MVITFRSKQKTPYALYIHLNEFEDIWGESANALSIALYGAQALLKLNIALNDSDPRAYIDKPSKREMLENALRFFSQNEALLKKLLQLPALEKEETFQIDNRLNRFRSENLYGPEDTLFASVHLIAESWFLAVHCLLDRAGTTDNKAEMANLLSAAAKIIDAQQYFIRILEYMSHADYHRLRVNLRDASGAQSQRMFEVPQRARAVFDGFWSELKREGIPPLKILHLQKKYVDLYHVLSAFQDLTRSFQSFLFGHFLMVSKILGSSSIGSMGVQVNGMVAHAATSIFPELDQLFYDYTQITNFRYGHMSGRIVMEKELQWKTAAYRPYLKVHYLKEDKVRQTVLKYFKSIENQQIEDWIRLFHPVEGQMSDAPGSRPYKGSQKLAIFMKNFYKAFKAVKPRILELTVDRNYAECIWEMKALTYHQTAVRFSGKETFWLNDKYQIMFAEADYDAKALSSQIMDGFNKVEYPRPEVFEMYH